MPSKTKKEKEKNAQIVTRSASSRRAGEGSGLSPAQLPRSFATLAYGLAGSLLLWLALPPVGWWPVAWVAPLPWLWLVRLPGAPGRRPYGALYLAGLTFWLLALHWLRLPHPATSLGWLALAGYLGCYLPVFIGLTRVAVHRLRISIILAAPIVWTGLEFAQSHALTGINIATPGHSQYRWITLIQISDLCGGYGVSFVILLVAACFARLVPIEGARRAWWALAPAAAVLAATLLYGHQRMAGDHLRPGLKVALIQGSTDTVMKADPAQRERIHQQHCELTFQAVREHPNLDLIVWPETMYLWPMISYSEDYHVRDDVTLARLKGVVAEQAQLFADLAKRAGAPLLLGMDRYAYGADKTTRYNSAVLIDRDGPVRACYDKMRRVMFGEYVPFAQYWPWLYRLTPLAEGIDAGIAPISLEVKGVRLAPNICFETLLPHFIRGQVDTLRRAGKEPDLLVNLTNDGWFWGSSELDLHLMCGAIRAVECRKPLLIAANTGFSAVIDADGRVLKQGRRRDTDILVSDVSLDTRHSLYVRAGDWGAGLCLALTAVAAIVGFRDWRSRSHSRPAG